MKTLGLYVDIPFCIQRCSFCAFNVRGYREAEASRYLESLTLEIGLASGPAAGMTVDTIYLGGGTPSRYPPESLGQILMQIGQAFQVDRMPEITLEAHPATLDREGLDRLRALGINRLSLGVQSLREEDLRAMGRHHTVAEVDRIVEEARAAGFDNIGIDLIYALPNQTLSDWKGILDHAVALGSDHLSVYGLSVEPGTLWGKWAQEGKLSLPDEAEEIALYRMGQRILSGAGYRQYEISNYSRPGRECRHNLRYWEGTPCVGIGLSAHSHVSGERWANTDDLERYIGSVQEGRLPIVDRERVSHDQRLKEDLLFGLRKLEGVRWTGAHEARFGERLKPLLTAGLLLRENGRVRLSERGILLADEVAVDLI
jgi:oxygen-independent coproporphyrinogen-3 oxidase